MTTQRRNRNGTWAHSDHTRKSQSEKLAFQAAEAELMKVNAARPMPPLYRSIDEVKAEQRENERLGILRMAAIMEAKGNFRGAAVFKEAAERLEVK